MSDSDYVFIKPDGFSFHDWYFQNAKYDFVRPLTLREVGGTSRIVGRTIKNYENSLGSYGMGGCGFVGIQFAKNDVFSEEWLILCLWSAQDWLVYHGKPIITKHDKYLKKLLDSVIGQKCICFDVQNKNLKMELQNNNGLSILELPEGHSNHNPYAKGTAKKLDSTLSLLDAIVISPTWELLSLG